MRKSFTYEGKRHFIRCENETDFEVKKALLIKKLDEGRITVTRNTPVSEWADIWLESYKEGTVSDGTFNDYKLIVKHIKQYFGSTKLKDIKPVHCQNLLKKYADLEKSKSFVDKLCNTMSQIFRQAVKNELMYSNPADSLNKPKAPEGTHRALSQNERDVILKVAETSPIGLWVKAMLYCGLRPGETALVKGKHVEAKNKVLHVPGTKTKNADRLVPIPNFLIEDLSKVNGNDHIFVTDAGKPPSQRAMTRWWAGFKRQMNIELGAEMYRNKLLEDRIPDLKDNPSDSKLTLYCLRHTYCTDLQNAGVPINVAKELMGHSDISITAKIYTHQSDVSFNNAAEKINEYANILNKNTSSDTP